MNDDAVLKLYEELNKTQIINAYKKYLEDNKRYRKKNDGFKGRGQPKLERPRISNVTLSWREFKRLPKASVIVHTFSEGCDTLYLTSLKNKGFFKETREWHRNYEGDADAK